nr:hypothetical protein [Mammaliicoccus sp. Marseille-Q6498]
MQMILIGILAYLLLFVFARYFMKHEYFALIHFLFAFIFICFIQVPVIYFEKLHSEFNSLMFILGLLFTTLMSLSMFLQGICNLVSNTNLFSNHFMDKIFNIISDPIEIISNILKSVWLLILGFILIQNQDIILGLVVMVWGFTFVYYANIFSNYITKGKKGFKPNTLIINLETVVIFIILYIGAFYI